jgi:hypothetical protein
MTVNTRLEETRLSGKVCVSFGALSGVGGMTLFDEGRSGSGSRCDFRESGDAGSIEGFAMAWLF